MPTALVTGASRGLGRALADALADRQWNLVVDARGEDALTSAAASLARRTTVHAIPGDIADPVHRDHLAAAVSAFDGLDLLVLNAGVLGPSPLPAVDDADPDALLEVLRVNTVAPLALYQRLRGHLVPGAVVIAVTSDAAVEDYDGWGAYGASKAALDRWIGVLGGERPDLRVHALDPGDMRTAMHQAAFPDEDISDRPDPVTVVPALLRLIDEAVPSGRHRASDLLPSEVVA